MSGLSKIILVQVMWWTADVRGVQAAKKKKFKIIYYFQVCENAYVKHLLWKKIPLKRMVRVDVIDEAFQNLCFWNNVYLLYWVSLV